MAQLEMMLQERIVRAVNASEAKMQAANSEALAACKTMAAEMEVLREEVKKEHARALNAEAKLRELAAETEKAMAEQKRTIEATTLRLAKVEATAQELARGHVARFERIELTIGPATAAGGVLGKRDAERIADAARAAVREELMGRIAVVLEDIDRKREQKADRREVEALQGRVEGSERGVAELQKVTSSLEAAVARILESRQPHPYPYQPQPQPMVIERPVIYERPAPWTDAGTSGILEIVRAKADRGEVEALEKRFAHDLAGLERRLLAQLQGRAPAPDRPDVWVGLPAGLLEALRAKAEKREVEESEARLSAAIGELERRLHLEWRVAAAAAWPGWQQQGQQEGEGASGARLVKMIDGKVDRRELALELERLGHLAEAAAQRAAAGPAARVEALEGRLRELAAGHWTPALQPAPPAQPPP